MDAGIVKKGSTRLCEHIPLTYPAMGWYFADGVPAGVKLSEGKGPSGCLFAYIGHVLWGETLCFTHGRTGCRGASCYLGFTDPSSREPSEGQWYFKIFK